MKVLRVIVILLLFLCLILIRAFEYDLFYDPLLQYFEGDHLTQSIPDLNMLKLWISYLYRFSLNTAISFAILKIAFPKDAFFKTITQFYLLAFVVLSILFFGLLISKLEVGYLFLFYLRRFIIQPIFVILLFPFLYLIKKGYHFNED